MTFALCSFLCLTTVKENCRFGNSSVLILKRPCEQSSLSGRHAQPPHLTALCLPSCVKVPLKALSITNCLILEIDLMHLSQQLNVSQLKVLNFRGLNMTNIRSGPLQYLLERASPTLQKLKLDECGIRDPQFMDLLRVLSHCSQLLKLSFCENTISMTVLKDLLRHTIGLRKLNCVLYAVPLECYEGRSSTIHLGRLAQVHAVLKQMLQELGRPTMVWFSGYPNG